MPHPRPAGVQGAPGPVPGAQHAPQTGGSSHADSSPATEDRRLRAPKRTRAQAPLTSAASSPGSSRSRLQPRDAVTSSSVRQQLSTNSLSSCCSRRRSSTGGGSPSMAAPDPPEGSRGTAGAARGPLGTVGGTRPPRDWNRL